jgi:hypothetical protein
VKSGEKASAKAEVKADVKQAKKPATPRVTFAPMLGTDGAGAMVLGRF